MDMDLFYPKTSLLTTHTWEKRDNVFPWLTGVVTKALQAFQLPKGVLNGLSGQVDRGHLRQLPQGQAAGRLYHGVVHQPAKAALKDRPGSGIIQQLPHRDALIAQIQEYHLLCSVYALAGKT